MIVIYISISDNEVQILEYSKKHIVNRLKANFLGPIFILKINSDAVLGDHIIFSRSQNCNMKNAIINF